MNRDFLDLLGALSVAEARFLIVGGYAVAAHGHVRATKDLDVWVEPVPDNAARVMAALVSFGAPLSGLRESDLASPHYGFMMGAPPSRIDILTTISGVTFAEAWPNRLVRQLSESVSATFIGREELLANKAASGRPQDLADIVALRSLGSEPIRTSPAR